jgi:hypothetical protein
MHRQKSFLFKPFFREFVILLKKSAAFRVTNNSTNKNLIIHPLCLWI